MTTGADDSAGRVTAEQRLAPEYVRECLELRDGEVYWRSRPARHFASDHAWKVFQTKYAGKPAGRQEANGYIAIHMRHQGERIQFQAHRVIWFLHYGRWPEKFIDHINRDRADNRIENMREATTAENNKNSASKRVYPYVFPYHHGRFAAQTNIGGEAAVHLGIFDTEEEAAAYRAQVNAELMKLAKSLAKKTPRPKTNRKRHQTFPPKATDEKSPVALPDAGG